MKKRATTKDNVDVELIVFMRLYQSPLSVSAWWVSVHRHCSVVKFSLKTHQK